MWSCLYAQKSRDQFVIWDVALFSFCCEQWGSAQRDADYFVLLLQIATFFSNNLDFFTSAAYSPKGSTVALSPLQAESMLANKKKASAYIHAIKKVRWLNYEMFYNFAFLYKNG